MAEEAKYRQLRYISDCNWTYIAWQQVFAITSDFSSPIKNQEHYHQRRSKELVELDYAIHEAREWSLEPAYRYRRFLSPNRTASLESISFFLLWLKIYSVRRDEAFWNLPTYQVSFSSLLIIFLFLFLVLVSDYMYAHLFFSADRLILF